MKIPVSVVIPCSHSQLELGVLIRAIIGSTAHPAEVIVVNSGQDFSGVDDHKKLLEDVDCTYISVASNGTYPGAARNKGLQYVTQDLVCFLDIRTLPVPNFFEVAYKTLQDCNGQGVYGSTEFQCYDNRTCALRDTIFGRKPVRTLPGTLLKKSVLTKSGLFLEWAVAGEDQDWLNRIEDHKLNFVSYPGVGIHYVGLENTDLFSISKKWYYYYVNSLGVRIGSGEVALLLIIIIIILVIIAFNWNYQISPMFTPGGIFVPNITKVTVAVGPVLYFFDRSFYRPLKRGVPLRALLPFRFFKLFYYKLYLDCVKVYAFIVAKLRSLV